MNDKLPNFSSRFRKYIPAIFAAITSLLLLALIAIYPGEWSGMAIGLMSTFALCNVGQWALAIACVRLETSVN